LPRAAAGIGEEAFTEGLQNYIGQKVDQTVLPDRPTDWEGIKNDAIAGAIMGGPAAALHGGHGEHGSENEDVGGIPLDSTPPQPETPPESGEGTFYVNTAGDVQQGRQPEQTGQTKNTVGDLFDTLNERFGPGLRERARTTKDYVSDTIDRMGEAAKTAQTPSEFLRQVFGGSTEDAAAADLRPDTEDPGVMNSADPAAAMQQRDAQRQERAAAFAEELLNDPATPDAVKERVASFGGDFTDPEAQAFVARTLVAQRAGEKLANAVNGLIDLIDLTKDFGGKATEVGTDLAAKARDMVDKGMTAAADRIVKKNLQGVSLVDAKPLVDALAQRLGPSGAAKAPELAQKLLALSVRMSPEGRITPEMDSRLRSLSDVVDDNVLDMVTEVSGSDGLRQALARIRAIPSAQTDVATSDGSSFLESMLVRPLADGQRKQLAKVIDEAGLQLKALNPTRRDQLLTGLAAAFGSKENAQTVVEYYGNLRREAMQREASTPSGSADLLDRSGEDVIYDPNEGRDENAGDTYEGHQDIGEFGTLTERDAEEMAAGYRNPTPDQPFSRFFDRAELRKAVNAARAAGDTNARRATLREYVDQTEDETYTTVATRIRNNLLRRLRDAENRDTDSVQKALKDLESIPQEQRNEAYNDLVASLRSRKTENRTDLPRLRKEVEGMDRALGVTADELRNATPEQRAVLAERIAKNAPKLLDRYAVVMSTKDNAKASDARIKAFRKVLDDKSDTRGDKAREDWQARGKKTAIAFKMVGKSQLLRLSAESMVYESSVRGSVARRLAESIGDVLNRPDVEGLVTPSPDTIVKRVKGGTDITWGDIASEVVVRKNSPEQRAAIAKAAASRKAAAAKREVADFENRNGLLKALRDVQAESLRSEIVGDIPEGATLKVLSRLAPEGAVARAKDASFEAALAWGENLSDRAAKYRAAENLSTPQKIEAAKVYSKLRVTEEYIEQQLDERFPLPEPGEFRERFSDADDVAGIYSPEGDYTADILEAEERIDVLNDRLEAVSDIPGVAKGIRARIERATEELDTLASGPDVFNRSRMVPGLRETRPEAAPKSKFFSAEAIDALYDIAVKENYGRLDTPEKVLRYAAMARVVVDKLSQIPESGLAKQRQELLRKLRDDFKQDGYAAFDWESLWDGMKPTDEQRALLEDIVAKKSAMGAVVKKSLMGVKTGLDFDNKRVQDLLTAVGFYGWQDPELTGWGARNHAQAEHDAFRDHLTMQDVLTAAKMQRDTGVKGGDNSDAGYVGLNYLRKKIAENSGAGTGVPAYHKYIRQQMEGMPSVMERAWEEYDGDGRVKAEWDKLSPKEKLAANARRIEAERADKAYDARMDAAGIPKQFRVRHTGMGMDTAGNYRGPEYSFFTNETPDGVELGASRYFDPPDADDDPRDFTPEEVDLGTHPNMEAAEIAASKFLMSKAEQQPSGGPRGKVVKNSFVGAKADPEGAESAAKALDAGQSAEFVWSTLGWFRGPDDKLRKEIRSPVFKSRVRNLARRIVYDAFMRSVDEKRPETITTLGAFLKGVPGMENLVDKLKGVTLSTSNTEGLLGDKGSYQPKEKRLSVHVAGAALQLLIEELGPDKLAELATDADLMRDINLYGNSSNFMLNVLSNIIDLPIEDVENKLTDIIANTIAHEIQHAFQHVEGFESGGNAITAVIAKYGDVDEYLAAIRNGDEGTVESIVEQAFAQLRAEVGPDGDMEMAAHKLYKNIIGEVEANDVAARMKLSDEEAASLKPALMDAKREFVRSVLLAEALSTFRSRVNSSKVGGRPGRPGKDWGDKDAAKAEILRLRGKGVKVLIEKLVKQLGGSGRYTYDPATGERLIELAINAISTVGTARHEAMHDLFRFLSENDATRSVARDLRDATSAPHVIRQLRELLKDHKAALEQLNDPEERAAYAYQFWAEGLLRIGPTGTGIFHTIRQFIKDLFGVVTAGQRGEDLMRAFHDGKFADPSVVQEVLQDINDSSGDRLANKMERAAPALTRALNALFSAAPDRLRRFENDHLRELADKFQPESGTGFVQNKFQQEGVWTNRLAGILRGTTAVERREAIDQLQAMKPTSKLAKDLAKFNEDIYEYMRDAGVQSWDSATKKFVPLRKVQGYFTRSWDPDAIARNRSEFEALLRTEGGVSAANAAALVENLVRGSEQRPKPEESPVDLGFMPYAPHTSERVLTFIKPSNADKFAKFQRKDLADIMTSYVRGSTHRAEYAREFGNNGEKIVELVAKSGIKDTKELGEISNAVQALEGSLDPGNWSVQTKEAMSALMTLQNVTLLPLALFSQMIDPIVLAARTGDIKDAGTAYVTALKRLKNTITKSKNKVPGEELAEILGVVSEDSTLQAMSMAYGTTRMSKRMENINRVFFKYNGMQGWNNSMRIAATAAGERYLLAHRKDAKALAELGLEPKDIKAVGGKLDVSSPKVQQAMFQFVDQAVLRPSAANRPVWMSDPRFLLVAHLKQFTFAMQNVVLKRASRELADGNPKPWGVLMLTMPVILAADMAKFALTGTGPSTWGFKDYLVHAVERSGLLGLGDFRVQAMRGVNMGKMPGEELLGPTFENLMEILRWIGGDPRTGLGDVVDRTVPGARFI